MSNQLTMKAGVALIAALALAGALAMFVFGSSHPVAAQTSSDDVTRSFSATQVAAEGTLDVTITLNAGLLVGVAETLPRGWSYDSVSPSNVDVTATGQTVSFDVLTGEPVTYTVTAPDAAGTATFSGMYAIIGTPDIMIGGDSSVTVYAAGEPPPTTTIPSIVLSSHEPGAAVQITISDTAVAAITPNQDIRVDLAGFSVPSTIADSDVQISSDGYNGNPSNVVVNGKKVTMTVPNVKANGDDQTENVMGEYTIRIKQSAGVTNAASGGTKTVKWQENFPDGAEKEADVSIDRVVKLSKTSGTRGTMITATFKGFANGSATVNLNNEKLDEVTISDNTGTLEIDTTSSKFLANRMVENEVVPNEITAQDAAGNDQDVSGKFTIKPKAVVDPEESPVSKEVTIKLSDWPAGNEISEVKIGSSVVTPSSTTTTDSDGAAEFKVMVPADANRGTQTVKVTGTEVDDSTPSATASLSVGVLALTIQPAMVVPGQQITIEGSGFVAGDEIDEVTIGNQTAEVDATANSAGDVVIAVNVPSDEGGDGIGSGKKTVSVTAAGSSGSSGRVAEGSIEIPKATIALDPGESRRGTTVNVSGSGFPSGDLVQVRYENNNNFVTVAAGSADASGAIDIDFTVPSYARIGSKHNIEATSVGVFKGVTAKAVHNTPGAMVSLSTDNISSGQSIIVSGMNFPAFATVAVMEIGGVDVRAVPAPATSIDGDFVSTVLVPQLELGNQTVSVRVGQTTITTFLEIGTGIASTDPTDVFAGLIADGSLSTVWHLDAATQAWTSFSTDPNLADFNSLTEITGGQVYTLIMTAGGEFMGSTLFAGTNQVYIP